VTFDHLLTVPEVAEKLRVKPETVRRWLRSGALRGRQMGGRRGGYRIATSEVDRFFREKSDGHAPEGA
jgi:excisionase family DNA binding protein